MRYFIAFVVALGLLFVLLFLLFHGGGKPTLPQTHKTLDSYATTDAQAQMTIDGPVNADQTHQAITITVDSNAVIYEQVQGYQGNVVNVKTFANNNDAYANFLLALAHAGFTKGSNAANLRDERGYCPQGVRYIFQFMQDGQVIERYWSSSCGTPETYQGNLNLTIGLFRAQVPNYKLVTKGVKL